MVERGEHFGLTLEAGHSVSVKGEGFWKKLDSYVASKLRVAGTVHLTDPASAARIS